MPRTHAGPPPLPENLSERLKNSINPKTGFCIYHPEVRLCKLVDDGKRWTVRRKTCHQCGCRSSVGGLHHMPGKAVKNPSNTSDDHESSFRSRSGRSRRSGISRDSDLTYSFLSYKDLYRRERSYGNNSRDLFLSYEDDQVPPSMIHIDEQQEYQIVTRETPRIKAKPLPFPEKLSIDEEQQYQIITRNTPRIKAKPPPLPENLSERLKNSINPKTGFCIYHPEVRLCKLVDDGKRWTVRRKTCHQCGCRSSVGGLHHMPGKAVKNPSSSRDDPESSFRSRSSRSRSRDSFLSHKDGQERSYDNNTRDSFLSYGSSQDSCPDVINIDEQQKYQIITRDRPRIKVRPPPLPENLSERLKNSINPKTGFCIYHPEVRLCKLVDDGTRWTVRRKTCHRCGCRSSVGGLHHMPGKAVKNPSNSRDDRESSCRSGRSRRSGSGRGKD